MQKRGGAVGAMPPSHYLPKPGGGGGGLGGGVAYKDRARPPPPPPGSCLWDGGKAKTAAAACHGVSTGPAVSWSSVTLHFVLKHAKCGCQVHKALNEKAKKAEKGGPHHPEGVRGRCWVPIWDPPLAQCKPGEGTQCPSMEAATGRHLESENI